MGKRILVIGGTGLMGEPVARHLRKGGFAARRMVRNVEQALHTPRAGKHPVSRCRQTLLRGFPSGHSKGFQHAPWLATFIASTKGPQELKSASDFMAAFEKIGERGDLKEATIFSVPPKSVWTTGSARQRRRHRDCRQSDSTPWGPPFPNTRQKEEK